MNTKLVTEPQLIVSKKGSSRGKFLDFYTVHILNGKRKLFFRKLKKCIHVHKVFLTSGKVCNYKISHAKFVLLFSGIFA